MKSSFDRNHKFISRSCYVYTLAVLATACCGCGIITTGGTPKVIPSTNSEPSHQGRTADSGGSSAEDGGTKSRSSAGSTITINGKRYPFAKDIMVEGNSIVVDGKSFPSSSNINIKIDNGDIEADPIIGNGKVSSISRTVAPFHSITLNGSLDVSAVVGSKTSVTVNGDSNLLGLVRTVSQNGEITIDTQKSYTTDNPLTVNIVTRSLDGLSLNGSGSIVAKGLNASQMSMNINGSGNIDADGAATALSADLEGSGNINAQNVTTPQADVEVNGSGNVTVNATKSIKADLNGSGNITYYGNPSTTANHTNGSGSIAGA